MSRICIAEKLISFLSNFAWENTLSAHLAGNLQSISAMYTALPPQAGGSRRSTLKAMAIAGTHHPQQESPNFTLKIEIVVLFSATAVILVVCLYSANVSLGRYSTIIGAESSLYVPDALPYPALFVPARQPWYTPHLEKKPVE
eukprot:1340867-Amorphochlora_amoeboformis.AAC.1